MRKFSRPNRSPVEIHPASPTFKVVSLSAALNPIPDECERYIVRDGEYRRIIGLRYQKQSDRYVAFFPGEQTLQIIEIEATEHVFISEINLNGRRRLAA